MYHLLHFERYLRQKFLINMAYLKGREGFEYLSTFRFTVFPEKDLDEESKKNGINEDLRLIPCQPFEEKKPY